MRFMFGEGSLDVPDDTRDDSVQILTMPVADALPLTVTIRRRPCPPDAALSALVDAGLAKLGDRQSSFEVVWRRLHQLGGTEAIIVAAVYKQGDGPITQRLVYLRHGARLLLMVASMPGVFPPAHLELLNKVATSLRLFDADGPTREGPAHV